jgi:hypothetical protein
VLVLLLVIPIMLFQRSQQTDLQEQP